jgi:hypothetical protein
LSYCWRRHGEGARNLLNRGEENSLDAVISQSLYR